MREGETEPYSVTGRLDLLRDVVSLEPFVSSFVPVRLLVPGFDFVPVADLLPDLVPRLRAEPRVLNI